MRKLFLYLLALASLQVLEISGELLEVERVLQGNGTSPTAAPLESPVVGPTGNPTTTPTGSPTKNPTATPTNTPTVTSTNTPTKNPTFQPTSCPSACKCECLPNSGPTSSPITEEAPPASLAGPISGGTVGAAILFSVFGFLIGRRTGRRNKNEVMPIIRLDDDVSGLDMPPASTVVPRIRSNDYTVAPSESGLQPFDSTLNTPSMITPSEPSSAPPGIPDNFNGPVYGQAPQPPHMLEVDPRINSLPSVLRDTSQPHAPYTQQQQDHPPGFPQHTQYGQRQHPEHQFEGQVEEDYSTPVPEEAMDNVNIRKVFSFPKSDPRKNPGTPTSANTPTNPPPRPLNRSNRSARSTTTHGMGNVNLSRAFPGRFNSKRTTTTDGGRSHVRRQNSKPRKKTTTRNWLGMKKSRRDTDVDFDY